ncbi:hypothetical protein [Oleiharenicola lentus]|uniref:hypothetical protein n=1 Tax=Oleiharenicola lentus TaxID=2508720 RepID=UPI003F67BC2B
MNAPLPLIAVVSQTWQGHVPAYHRNYARAFAAAGAEVLEIKPASADFTVTPEVTKKESVLRRGLRSISRIGPIRALWWWRWAARRVAVEEKRLGKSVDAIFFTYLDLHFVASKLPVFWVDLQMGRPWGGILLHPSAARGVEELFPGAECVFRSNQCRAVAVIDDIFIARCRSNWPGKKVIAVPELADVSPPAENSLIAGEIKRWAEGRCVVGLLGVVTCKKNVETFLAVARATLATKAPYAFVIAGECSAHASGAGDFARLKPLLDVLPENCRVWLRRIEDGAEFNAVVTACDILFLAYRPAAEHSNVLVKAAYFQKPSLVSEGHLMARDAREFQLGEVVPPANVAATVAALESIRSTKGPRNFEGYYHRHSLARLDEVVPAMLTALK